MGRIIAIINQKGGVGKTTTAVNLSAMVAELGCKTLVVDMDPQGNTTSGLGMEAPEKSIYEVLLGRADVKDCIEETEWRNLWIAGSDTRLAGAQLELVPLEQREYRLRTVLRAVQKDYDFVFVDCPPSLSLLTVNAMAAADRLIIPIQCEYYALEGVTALMNTVSMVRRSVNPRLEIEGVVLTMLDGRTNLGLQVVSEVKKVFKKKVYATTIPRNVRLGEAPSHGQPIHVYDPRSTGALAYKALAEEFLKANGIKVKKD